MAKDRTYKREQVGRALFDPWGEPVPEVPSVTTITGKVAKPFLIQWAANCAVDYVENNLQSASYFEGMKRGEVIDFLIPARTAHKRILEEAGELGSRIHNIAEHYSRGITTSPIGMSEAESEFATLFPAWCKEHNVKPIAIEQVVVGEGYAGRVDLICEIDWFWAKSKDEEWRKWAREQRVIALIDIKTGKAQFYEDWDWQIAGYRQACEDEFKITHHGALKFSKKTYKLSYKDLTPTYEFDKNIFNSWRDGWWHRYKKSQFKKGVGK